MSTNEELTLAGRVAGELYGRFTERCSHIFGGETYSLAAPLGDEPLVLVRKSDGRRFEVEVGAIVTEVAGVTS